ncbi:cobyric acid synthase CobQ [Propionibacterium sp. HMSC075A12]|jgi:adenosylcobyric acid synthase|uniref:Cobyric acid synthase n=3 Tax=Actinomycetes TaxID=1760 RepID=A0AA44U6B0_CUTAC|nr:cobyric acid synthase [Cutibacterium acnes subsp. defendens ATCC 11828]ALD69148.1 cobalamin biosynthesis protein CobQ [Cutibacterium acnes]EFB88316.1 cobyric acid synthase CobQ [Cutibacterium acnes J139]EFT26557.1 cobyric acid synthase CobQ [Cutibacterium acnes HL110PA3]EFT62522.1 cobyric acid synthase CobQ [Cutibacterium acnes HL110PA4]EFT66043.1 cobyric acid synthase CobQ [Cutibacterium acnes HL060PA1]ERS33735.1 cobyric acid synthase [Propionibacterium sp. KPL1847]ERS67638.1 cobyric aci
MTGILVAGTSSDAGKSLVVTALCRVARRRGIDVVPFKAQNMSNNSMVCADGSEIGRAQYLQATAAGVKPTSAMNPVLLKPGTDRRSFVVLRGKPGGVLEAGEYTTGRRHLAEVAWAAYDELAASHDVVICEGAGSPAEINLRRGDYTNMGLAQAKNLPVVLVGDIDRGGVLASLFGTWALLDDDDRALLAGYIVNKFRGDDAILAPGLEEITDRTGMPSFGVLPWVPGVWLDGEDALEVGRWRHEGDAVDPSSLRVAVVRFPRISNATDVDAMAGEAGVDVQVTTNPDTCQAADVLVLPGSRSTVSDLEWLRRSGIADVVARRAKQGRTVVGICGGYQMLCRTILDPDGQETAPGSVVEGLGLLPVEVNFAATKTLALSHGTWRGIEVGGYEIHHGVCRSLEDAEAFLDGIHVGPVWGTMWHGAFEHDEFRRTWLADAARHAGSSWRPHSDELGYQARREAMIETLADALEAHVDVDRILHLAR